MLGEAYARTVPADELLVRLRVVAPGQEAPALHLEQDRRDEKELRKVFDGDRDGFVTQGGDEGVDDGTEWDIEDVDVVTGNHLEQQLHGAAEVRRRHDEGHGQTLLLCRAVPSRRIAQ